MGKKKWKGYGEQLEEPLTGRKDSAFFDININPSREEGESYEDYKIRQKEVKKRIKLHLKGRKVN